MGFELTTLVGIGTDCTGSCKSNYHVITMSAPQKQTETDSLTTSLEYFFLLILFCHRNILQKKILMILQPLK